MRLNDPKVINAWCMFDWANSAYSLTITSAVFPVYYNAVTKTGIGNSEVNFFGIQLANTVLYSYGLALSFLIAAFLSPLLSGIADYTGQKKKFMQFFTYMGGIACIALFWFDGTSNIEFGIISFVIAGVGYAGSLVFYNAYLPEIATADRFDIVSAKGYSLGYIGSVLLLIFNLLMITFPSLFFGDVSKEVGETLGAKWSFVSVGVWWIVFAQYTFSRLPSNVHNRMPGNEYITKGFKELRLVFHEFRQSNNMMTFLGSFFLYSMSVQTVMYLAAAFGEKTLNLASDKLIATVLIIQLVGVGGAYLFAYLSKIKGNKYALMTMLGIWIGISSYAYFMQSEYEFYVLAAIVGMVMGGIQSLSRATYSKLIPDNTLDHTSYFSFYDVVEKVATCLGMFSFGLVENLTDNMRLSIIPIVFFFVLGFLIMIRVKVARDAVAADQKG